MKFTLITAATLLLAGTALAHRGQTVNHGYHKKYLMPSGCSAKSCYDTCREVNYCSCACQSEDAITPAAGPGDGSYCHCYKGGARSRCRPITCEVSKPEAWAMPAPAVMDCPHCNKYCAAKGYCYGTCHNYTTKSHGAECMCYGGDKCTQCSYDKKQKREVLEIVFLGVDNTTDVDNSTMYPMTTEPLTEATTLAMPSSATSQSSLPSLFGTARQRRSVFRKKRNIFVNIFEVTRTIINNATHVIRNFTEETAKKIVHASQHPENAFTDHIVFHPLEHGLSNDEAANATSSEEHGVWRVLYNATRDSFRKSGQNWSQLMSDEPEVASHENSTDTDPDSPDNNVVKRDVIAVYETPLPASPSDQRLPKLTSLIINRPGKQVAFAKDGIALNVKSTANFAPHSNFVSKLNIDNSNGTLIFRHADLNATISNSSYVPQ